VRESVIEEKVTERFESTGWLVRKCVYAGRRGSPDRWFLKSGVWLLVEFKRKGEKPDAQQQREHDRLRGHGQRVHVIDSIDDGYALHAKFEKNLFGAEPSEGRVWPGLPDAA
jgi:hypothetical protein